MLVKANKKGGHFRGRPFGNVFSDQLGVLRFLYMAPFAQSLREPFSPRSSKSIHRRLAIVLLRVCAPEVKKKFHMRATKKCCNPQKYFIGKICDNTASSRGRKTAPCP